MDITLRPMRPGEHMHCEKIMRGLPDWFGIEQAIVNYVRDIESMQTLIAESDNQIVGFLTLNQPFDQSAEMQVIAVAGDYHRLGIGRRLVEHAENLLRDRSVTYLQVKTLSPRHPDPHYAKTRRFYEEMGFVPLDENNLWGEHNPCLVMIKHLRATRPILRIRNNPMQDTPAPPLTIPKSPLHHAAPWLATIAITAATVVVLRLLGRVWWCEGGETFLWVSEVNSMHNSQHLLDAYSFSHLLHGLIFAGVFFLIAPLRRQRFAWRLSLAVLIEAGWEVFENTPFTINRYREATMALGYSGDSIGNSLGDLGCCALGFIIATCLRWYWSVAIFLGVELTMLCLIRDNLTLNVLMLIYPIEAIQQWQTAI